MEGLIDANIIQPESETKLSAALARQLATIARWAFKAGIFLYVFTGLSLLTFAMMIWFTAGYDNFSFSMACVQILSLLLYYALARTTHNFGRYTRVALQNEDEQKLVAAFQNLNTFFKAIGIISVLACVATAMILVRTYQLLNA